VWDVNTTATVAIFFLTCLITLWRRGVLPKPARAAHERAERPVLDVTGRALYRVSGLLRRSDVHAGGVRLGMVHGIRIPVERVSSTPASAATSSGSSRESSTAAATSSATLRACRSAFRAAWSSVIASASHGTSTVASIGA
jgi:hypothetical protein